MKNEIEHFMEAKKIVSYNPNTGIFKRTGGGNRRIKIGEIAGSKRRNRVRLSSTYNGVTRQFFAHRYAFWLMNGFIRDEIDHIDRNPSNNRISNLRIATRSQNQFNNGLRPDNNSGVTGVSKAQGGKWRARISKNGKPILIGTFSKKEDAIAARSSAEIELYGEFSPLFTRGEG